MALSVVLHYSHSKCTRQCSSALTIASATICWYAAPRSARYNKASSFFDTISSDAKRKEQKEQEDFRLDREKQREARRACSSRHH